MFDSIEDLANACLATPRNLETSPVPLLDRAELLRPALAFHARAGTLTPAVSAAAETALQGAPLVRFAHQPNLFMQFGLLGHFFAVQALAQAIQNKGHSAPVVAVYLLVDDDYADDRRFRVAHYPALGRKSGTAPLTLPEPAHRLIMARTPPPSLHHIDRWVSTLQNCIAWDIAQLNRYGWHPSERGIFASRLRLLQDELRELEPLATSAADYCALHLSRVINIHFNLPILFLSLDGVRRATCTQLSFLWEHYGDLSAHAASLPDKSNLVDRLRFRSDHLPFWVLCPCGARLRLDPRGPRSSPSANCSWCGRRHRVALKPGKPIDPEFVSAGLLRPRVLFDDMLDSLALGAIGGVGYVGSASHATLARTVLTKAGLPAVPEAFFRQTLAIAGTTELLASESARATSTDGIEGAARVLAGITLGRMSGLYAALNKGWLKISSGLRAHWTSAAPFQSPVHYDDPAPMSKFPTAGSASS